MVDVMYSKDQTNGEHIKRVMDKTQGVIKSRMLSFLGSSSDYLTGLSQKLESALSLSDSFYSTEEHSTKQLTTPSSQTASEYGPAMPSISRKLNSLPAFGMTFEDYEAIAKHSNKKRNVAVEQYRIRCEKLKSLEYYNATLDNDVACHLTYEEVGTSEKGNVVVGRDNGLMKISQSVDSNIGSYPLVATGPDPYDKLRLNEIPSSGSASDLDGYGPSTSIDTSGRKFWIRSGSEGSVNSWASSLSLDSQSDEVTVEFMRAFVSQLFKDSTSIDLDQKSKFGILCQSETGRLWFARFVNAQRGRSRNVSEGTFFSLVQHFAIVLFECAESDDFSPAKSLMNMCFTFYLEVDVPGCEPYKEYLYTYLRDQPIWHTVRFWNAAFFDALQCERIHQPVAAAATTLETFVDDKQYQENITFGQLGTFTYNMHAFGLSRELCMEFLRKQCTIANLSKEQETMLKENINRMYKETDPWRV